MKEAKGTAQRCAVKERGDGRGQGQERKEENDRVEIDLFEREKTRAEERKKKAKGKGKKRSGVSQKMYRKQTNAEGGDSRRILTAREIELLMGNNCHGGGGGEKNKIRGRKKNSFEHKERKRSAIFSGPRLPASSQCL